MPRRRKKDPPKPAEKVSAAWEAMKPWEPMYWKRGGPFVPVAEIVPHWQDASSHQPEKLWHWMTPKARLVYATEEVVRAEKELAGQIDWYVKLHEQGIDALANEWDRRSAREIDAEPARWDNVPSPLHWRQAGTYRQIGQWRSKIAACKALIEQLEAPAFPLFHYRDDA